MSTKAYTGIVIPSLAERVREYAVLIKFRLSLTVVLSAVLGFLFSTGGSLANAMLLTVGGFLVTGASNAFNQVWEKDTDALMQRTRHRPLVKYSLQVYEAVIFASVAVLSGLWMLYLISPLCMILGSLAFFTYVFVYTPLKRVSSWSVLAGAFPGAIPPMLGYVAASGELGLTPGLLFLFQFLWQFPHFWAIAWVQHDDYCKAGFSMLPSVGGRDSASTALIIIYTVACVAVSLSFFVTGQAGILYLSACMLLGIIFMKEAMKLHSSPDIKQGRRLMFTSFYYLPVLQFILIIDQWI